MRKLAGLTLAVLLVGCAGNNDDKVMVDANGKPQGAGVTRSDAPKRSQDFRNANPGEMNDSANVKDYRQATNGR